MEENRRNSYINYIEINDVSSAIISQGVTLNKKEKKKKKSQGAEPNSIVYIYHVEIFS